MIHVKLLIISHRYLLPFIRFEVEPFTFQLVWDDTTKMGIGMASDPDLTYITVVARYTSSKYCVFFSKYS